MKRAAVPALIAGAVLAGGLFVANDLPRVLRIVVDAGPWLIAPILLHWPQTVASALGWRPLIEAGAPGLSRLIALRWVRESINALLPVGQIGGDVARSRLLSRDTHDRAAAAASCTVDLAMEMATEIGFAALGLAVLLTMPESVPARAGIVLAMLVAGGAAAAFFAAQRVGLERLAGPLLRRLPETRRPKGLAAFDAALVRIHGNGRRLAVSAMFHFLSWLLGAVEVGAGMQVLHLPGGWRGAVAVESLGQIIRGMGFLIPGALGVQEGGYILVCGLFAIAPGQALALSLVRRVRELVLGAPGLLVWRLLETGGRRASVLTAPSGEG